MMILYAAGVLLAAVLVVVGAARIVRWAVQTSEEGPPQWWAVLLAAGALLAVLVGAAAAYILAPAPVSGRGITNSVERETNSTDLLESDCTEVRDGRWRCRVLDASGSGHSTYVVDAGWSCWTARRTENQAETPMPARAEGCTTLRDTLGLFDLVAATTTRR